jgi:hypothetical protein
VSKSENAAAASLDSSQSIRRGKRKLAASQSSEMSAKDRKAME